MHTKLQSTIYFSTYNIVTWTDKHKKKLFKLVTVCMKSHKKIVTLKLKLLHFQLNSFGHKVKNPMKQMTD